MPATRARATIAADSSRVGCPFRFAIPYASPSCTVPSASRLTCALDILPDHGGPDPILRLVRIRARDVVTDLVRQTDVAGMPGKQRPIVHLVAEWPRVMMVLAAL